MEGPRPSEDTIDAMTKSLRDALYLNLEDTLNKMLEELFPGIDTGKLRLWIQYRNPDVPRLIVEDPTNVTPTGPKTAYIEVTTGNFHELQIHEVIATHTSFLHQ
jgi:hypothetical protein